jgi:two-component system, cell cycle sensor histidine kinase and response regulator CckA
MGERGLHPETHPAILLGIEMPPLRGSILVVEDEGFVREVTAEILIAAGYRVLKAKNAAEALSLFKKGEDDIELLVSDVVLPGKNGRDLARDLTQTQPTLKTIFISGYPENPVTRNMPFMHEPIYLAKPFSVESLMRKVREAIRCETDTHS